jgi:hypothetical protein
MPGNNTAYAVWPGSTCLGVFLARCGVMFALNVVFGLFGLNPIYRPLFVHDNHLSRRTALEFRGVFFAAGFFTA